MKHKLGYAYYEIEKPLIEVIRLCKKHNLHCYFVTYKKPFTRLGFLVIEQKRVREVFPNAIFLYTNGITGMVLRNICKKTRIISYLCVILLWCLFSITLFQVNIYGESDALDMKIEKRMEPYKYQKINIKEMKSELLKTYKNDVSWLEIYQKGSVVNVRYAIKKFVTKNDTGHHPLVAKKDGMIAYFKCKEGFRTKKINDVVKKGDILVDNKMPNSFQQDISVNVEGKVYAYTWKEVVIEINENKLPKALNFYSMLLQARDEIHLDVENDEQVKKENVLQFSTNKGKMKLKVLYTLLEDITS